jgi:multisubunit Na+/H+ antiporter MnhE subunit
MPFPFLCFAILLPLLVAFGSAGLVRRRGGKVYGQRLSELAVPLGFLAGFAALAGGVPFIGNVVHHRVGELALFMLAQAAIFLLWAPGPRLLWGLAIIEAIGAIFWQLGIDGLPTEDWLLGIGAAAVAILVMRRLVTLGPSGAAAPLILALASLGLAILAGAMRAGVAGDFAAALTAALVGWLAWARPFGKGDAGPALLLGGGVIFVAVAFAIAHSALHAPWAVLLLLPAFWPEFLAARVPFLMKAARKKANRPGAYAAAAAVPVALVTLLALILA